MNIKAFLLTSILLSVPALSAEPDLNWPQWRGRDGGVSAISQGSFFIRGARHLFRIGL